MRDCKGRNSEKGLSLIELSVAMVVLSIIIVPLLRLYEMSQEKYRVTQNIEKLERITHALNRYAQQNGRLPAPASLRNPFVAKWNDPNYGVDVSNYTASFNTAPCNAMPTSVHVYCTPQSTTYPTNGGAGAEVLTGMVPFHSLGLTEDDAYDRYQSKITYMVTRSAVKTDSFKNNTGAIAIINQDGNLLDGGKDNPTYVTDSSGNKKSNVLYALISHGRDKKGAYDKSDFVTVDCSTAAGLDQANCNQQLQTWIRGMQAPDPKDNSKNVLSDRISLATGAQYFDDIIRYRTTTMEGMWTQQNVVDKTTGAVDREDIYMSGPQKVFVGGSKKSVEEAKYKLDVKGDVKTSTLTYSKSLCQQVDSTGKCFRVTNIGNSDKDATGEDAPIYCGSTGSRLRALNKIEQKGTSEKEQYAQKGCIEPAQIKSGTMKGKSSIICPKGFKGWETGKNLSCKE